MALITNIKKPEQSVNQLKDQLDNNLVGLFGSEIIKGLGIAGVYNNNYEGIIFDSSEKRVININTRKIYQRDFSFFDPVKLSKLGVLGLRFVDTGGDSIYLNFDKKHPVFPKNLNLINDEFRYFICLNSGRNGIKFEKGVYLPECYLNINNSDITKAQIEYLKPLIINGDLFLGVGVDIMDGNGTYNFDNIYTYSYRVYNQDVKNFFNNFENYSSMDHKESSYNTLKNLIPTNFPIYITYSLALIKLDGAIKGSIEQDRKFWASKFSKVPKRRKNDLYNDEYLILY